MRCADCFFWDERFIRSDGRAPCRVEGPKMTGGTDPTESSTGRWPRTLPQEWCGLWKAVPKPPPATRVVIGKIEAVD